MAEMMTNELDVNLTSTVVEDTCFVNIPDDEIKLENTEIQGKLDSLHLKRIELSHSWFIF